MIYTQDVNPIVLSATRKLVEFVKPTYGPNGKKVLINGQALDDAYSVVQAFELSEPFENEIIKVIREVASKTFKRAGDGTCTAILMAGAFLEHGVNSTGTLKKELNKKSTPIKSKRDLEKVALVSFKNKSMAKVVADLVWRVGRDGVVSVEPSEALQTSFEIVEGMRIDRGFESFHMAENGEARLENPLVLITDLKITSARDAIDLLNRIPKGESLVIIAEEVSGDALTTFVLNKLKNNFSTLVIKAPSFGSRRAEVLEDIATLCGATVISRAKGLKISNLDLKALGHFKRVIATKDETTFIGGKGKTKDRLQQIKKALEKASIIDKEYLRDRLSKLSGKVGILRVGAPTEQEMIALKYKVVNAVNASQQALRSGVILGGGITLKNIKTGSKKLDKALQVPYLALQENGVRKVGKEVLESTEVVSIACETAISIVSELLSLSGIITDELPRTS